jgi:hypothetical protein
VVLSAVWNGTTCHSGARSTVSPVRVRISVPPSTAPAAAVIRSRAVVRSVV